MKRDPRGDEPRGQAGSGKAANQTTGTATLPQTAPAAQRPYIVVVDADRPRLWGRYSTEGEAVGHCLGLKRHGIAARVLVRRTA